MYSTVKVQCNVYIHSDIETKFVKVSEDDIEEMFHFADKDQDGRISYGEFQVMVTPPKIDINDMINIKHKDTAKKVTIVDNNINKKETDGIKKEKSVT